MFYISYFYNIRFFPENLIPMSTAMWDPKWFHNYGPETIIFKDKRNVINGVRADALSPFALSNQNMCKGRDKCKYKPSNCKFLKEYFEYLSGLDFYMITSNLEYMANKLIPGSDICLIVYETPDNECSERQSIIKWFNANGVELPEWNKDLLK